MGVEVASDSPQVNGEAKSEQQYNKDGEINGSEPVMLGQSPSCLVGIVSMTRKLMSLRMWLRNGLNLSSIPSGLSGTRYTKIRI